MGDLLHMNLFANIAMVCTLKIPSARPMLFYCWASVADAGPAIKQHWMSVPCSPVSPCGPGWPRRHCPRWFRETVNACNVWSPILLCQFKRPYKLFTWSKQLVSSWFTQHNHLHTSSAHRWIQEEASCLSCIQIWRINTYIVGFDSLWMGARSKPWKTGVTSHVTLYWVIIFILK